MTATHVTFGSNGDKVPPRSSAFIHVSKQDAASIDIDPSITERILGLLPSEIRAGCYQRLTDAQVLVDIRRISIKGRHGCNVNFEYIPLITGSPVYGPWVSPWD